jgi:hypothetical protein
MKFQFRSVGMNFVMFTEHLIAELKKVDPGESSIFINCPFNGPIDNYSALGFCTCFG